jgi:DNA polymerase III alpha subunit
LCRTHPVSLVDTGNRKTVKGCDLGKHIGRTICFVGVLVSGKIVSTRTGEVMEFLSFEDNTAIVETTFFPRVYRRYAHLLAAGKIYQLSGLVEEDFGAITLTVKWLELLTRKF